MTYESIIKGSGDRMKEEMQQNKENPQKKTVLYLGVLTLCVIVAAVIFFMKLQTADDSKAQQWNGLLAEYLDADDTDMANLEKACDFPDVTVEKDGFTAKVVQTVADKHVVYYALEVTLPEEYVGIEDLTWETISFTLYNRTTDRYIEGTFGVDATKIEGNQMTMVGYNSSMTYDVNEQWRIEGVLEGLGSMDNHGNWSTLSPVRLEFSWDVFFEDTFQRYEVNQEITGSDGTEGILEHIEISPLSVWATVSGIESGRGCMPMITFQDGSALDQTLLPGAAYPPYDGDKPEGFDRTKSTIGCIYQTILDLSTVEKVTSAGFDVRMESN